MASQSPSPSASPSTPGSPIRGTWSLGLANALKLRTLPYHADQILISASIYQSLFSTISPIVSRNLFPTTYPKFPAKTRANWDSRVVGIAQAVFICSKALTVILTDPSRQNSTVQSRLWGYSAATGTVQAYAAGYFLWDIYVSARYWRLFGPTAFVHAVSAFTITMLGFVSFALSSLSVATTENHPTDE
jgi:hypothetical protein